jgi:hypothetical protein
MSDIEDSEEYLLYEKIVAEYNKLVIETRVKPVTEDPKVVNLYHQRIINSGMVPLEVALEMIECEYDPLNEDDIDEFYSDIVEQYILEIVKEKKKSAGKSTTNIIKFPLPRKKPITS